jgi:uncharacterized coiled-coil DUF342 family protein
MNLLSKREQEKAVEQPKKTREELFRDYQAAATGLVQRMSIISKLQNETVQLSNSIQALEQQIEALPKEAPPLPEAPVEKA